jgi:hypothetical protein
MDLHVDTCIGMYAHAWMCIRCTRACVCMYMVIQPLMFSKWLSVNEFSKAVDSFQNEILFGFKTVGA